MEEKEAQSKKPEDSDFQQQRLRAWQPLLTPKWVILTFFLIGVIFLPIGIAILVASRDVVEYSIRYDNHPSVLAACTPEKAAQGGRDITTPEVSKIRAPECRAPLAFKIDKTMKSPVFVYYKLSNFYQNHRRYVKSRSDIQLRGNAGPTDTTSCDPLSNFTPLNGTASLPIYPCGLIANSVFNDTLDGEFSPGSGPDAGIRQTLGYGGWDVRHLSDIEKQRPSNPLWTKQGISWETDRKEKFGFQNASARTDVTTIGPGGFELPRVDDEDFIVWMRTAGLPTFKKLYRIINRGFEPGDTIHINVSSVFPVRDFSGEKYVVISTTSWLGGKNDFLGVAYIVVGAICLFLAAIFLIKHCISPRPPGDMNHFNWPGQIPIRSKAVPRAA